MRGIIIRIEEILTTAVEETVANAEQFEVFAILRSSLEKVPSSIAFARSIVTVLYTDYTLQVYNIWF